MSSTSVDHRRILESVGPTLAESCGLKMVRSRDGAIVKLAELTDEYEMRVKLPDVHIALYMPCETMASGLGAEIIGNEIVARLELAKQKLIAAALRQVMDDRSGFEQLLSLVLSGVATKDLRETTERMAVRISEIADSLFRKSKELGA